MLHLRVISPPDRHVTALLADARGAVALTSARSVGPVGVLVSVTTVPAAAYACVALIEGRWTEAGLSIVQLVDVVGVVAGAAAVLVLTKRSRHNREDRGRRLSTG